MVLDFFFIDVVEELKKYVINFSLEVVKICCCCYKRKEVDVDGSEVKKNLVIFKEKCEEFLLEGFCKDIVMMFRYFGWYVVNIRKSEES